MLNFNRKTNQRYLKLKSKKKKTLIIYCLIERKKKINH